jgi:hypothetical protein
VRPLCIACSLVFFLLLVFGASSPGGFPSASPSGGDGRVSEVLEVAWAWCPGLFTKTLQLFLSVIESRREGVKASS